MTAVVGRDASTLRGLDDLHTYRRIMAAGTWGWLRQAVCATRAYQAGLDLSLLLLRVLDLHRPQLDRDECASSHRQQLYYFVLDMLDRLDRWDAYLAAWACLRARTAERLTYPLARATFMGRGWTRSFWQRTTAAWTSIFCG